MFKKMTLATLCVVASLQAVHATEIGFKPYIGLDITRSHGGLDQNYAQTNHKDGRYDTDGGYYPAYTENSTITNLKDVDLNSVGLRFGADITDFFALEGRIGTGLGTEKINATYAYDIHYEDGDNDATNGKTKVTQSFNHYVAALAKAQTPAYYGFRVHALGGVSYSQIEHTFIDLSASMTSKKENDTSFAYGGGLSYAFTEQVSTQVEYLKLHQDFDSINLGLTYHF
jgi:opacity protein-like surface antigen